jgi:hypothetical protein
MLREARGQLIGGVLGGGAIKKKYDKGYNMKSF